MTDHYDNPILLERLKDYQGMRPTVEQFWSEARQQPNSAGNESRLRV
jgi:hypothetical protein